MPEHEGKGEILEETKEPRKVELHITYYPEKSSLSVSGNIMSDLIASLGMLENAKAVIFQYQATKHIKSIEIPKGGIMNFVKGMNKGKRFNA